MTALPEVHDGTRSFGAVTAVRGVNAEHIAMGNQAENIDTFNVRR